MANRYEPSGLVLKKSTADDQVFVPVVDISVFGGFTGDDLLKTAGRLRRAKEAVLAELDLDPDYDYRWDHVGDDWVLMERAK